MWKILAIIELLLVASLPITAASIGRAPALQTTTGEEISLWGVGRLNRQLMVGRTYHVIGRNMGVLVTDKGLPLIGFPGLNLTLSKGFDRQRVERLLPGNYISANCVLTKTGEHPFPSLDRCTDLKIVPTVSADAYAEAYQNNMLKADSLFKNQDIILLGSVRGVGKLLTGENYIDLTVGDGFAQVTSIMSADAMPLIHEYAQVGATTVLACRGGYRYNRVGSVGARDCRFPADGPSRRVG